MLSEDSILKIYRWYWEGMPVRDIASHFDVTEPYVYNIIKGVTHKELHKIFFKSVKED